MFKLKAVAASILLALAGTAQADVITFDTDGVAGGAIAGVTTFDWQPGTAVAYGGNPTGAQRRLVGDPDAQQTRAPGMVR